MKKKNIILFLLMALPTLLLTSCLKDQEDLFTESASQRTTTYLAKAKKVLTSSENGWLLNYYPDREQSYGGTPFTMKFTDEKVTVACAELTEDPTYTVESTYILNNEDGPVLMFDTYNGLAHYFATPSGSSGAGGYEAYDGDFIFIILNISEDENTITLKGNRSGNIMYMHRLTGSATDYLAKAFETSENMPTNYTFQSDGKTVKVALKGGRASFTGENIDVDQAYIYTDKGIEFYEPVDINGVVFDGILNGGEAATTSSIGETPVQMAAIFPPINEIFIGADWYIAYKNQSDYAKTFFDAAIAGSTSEGEVIGVMAFTQDNGHFVLYFTSGRYAGMIAFDVELIGENQIKMTYNESNSNGNGTWYYKNAGYDKVVELLSHTYQLEPNSKVRPTVLKMVDTENPANTLTVQSAGIGF